MATLATTNPTLTDLAKRLDPGGSLAMIVEILNQTNEVLEDMPWIAGNLPTGHRTTVRSGIPDPTWRKLYGGVQPTKSETRQVTDNIGLLEAYAEVDKHLADLNGNTAAYRLSEDRPHIEGMAQTMASTIFYGNEGTKPESFTGLAPRFNERDPGTVESGENVLHGGGSGSDNTSVWLIVWGNQTCHGIYGKNGQAGLFQQDKGQVTIEDVDGNGGRMEAYRTHYKWEAGLSVRDWRYIVRIANVDVSELTADASSSSADLVDLMTQAMWLPPSLNAGRAAFYGNRTVMSYLDRQMKNAKNINLTVEQLGGKRTLMFGGIPVRRCDALLNTESTVPDSS
jgi:hypothetical protein